MVVKFSFSFRFYNDVEFSYEDGLWTFVEIIYEFLFVYHQLKV